MSKNTGCSIARTTGQTAADGIAQPVTWAAPRLADFEIPLVSSGRWTLALGEMH
jgi:hypothetical protein